MPKRRGHRGRQFHKKRPGEGQRPARRGRPESREPERPVEVAHTQIHPVTFQQAVNETGVALRQWHQDATDLIANLKNFKSDPLKLDPWQTEVFEALMAGENVIVDAPTTAGKTRAVEVFFHSHLQTPGFRAAYTTPVKSLSNDKLFEFREAFGLDNVGIATGDIKENLGAPIVVTTLETYRNSLLGVEPDLRRTLVVFDEYHFMQDGSRGSAWEEAIILTPDSCQLLMLSASVANAEEFCGWLEKIHSKPTRLVRATHRPVPLTDLVYARGQWLLAKSLPEKIFFHAKENTQGTPMPHPEVARRVAPLVELELTPCILYTGRRIACENLAREIAKVAKPFPREHSQRIIDHLQELHKTSNVLDHMDRDLRQMIEVKGVGFHHSGLVPKVRIAIETLLKDGLLRFCTATMGLSLGINFSVRSAVISDFRRPDETGFKSYTASEVLQMLGRAGRRGRDPVGYSMWLSIEQYIALGKPERNRCDSNLKNDPTTFLGLVSRGFDLEEIENFYNKSFRRFGDNSFDLSLVRPERLKSKLGTGKIPCESPAEEYATYNSERRHEALCGPCPFRKNCHRYLKAKMESDLSALHVHLHTIGALDRQEKLTAFGDMAKYFPHAGGMLIADMIVNGDVTEKNLGEFAEVMASFSLARFKTPGYYPGYRPPIDPDDLEDSLNFFYPYKLFPELYDPPFGKRRIAVIREFNPSAGFIVHEWLQGATWGQLEALCTNEKFGSGDLMAVLYRVASYLQSLAQIHYGDLSKYAKLVREQILRDPL